MRRLKVRTVQPPVDATSPLEHLRLYSLHLGNGRLLRFTSERQALAAQADASRFLTDQLHEVNLLLVDCFAAFRMAWPMLHGGEHHQLASTCRQHLATAVDLLERAVTHTNGPNGHALAWRFVGGASTELALMCQALQQQHQRRSWYVEVRRLRSLQARAHQVVDALARYGA